MLFLELVASDRSWRNRAHLLYLKNIQKHCIVDRAVFLPNVLWNFRVLYKSAISTMERAGHLVGASGQFWIDIWWSFLHVSVARGFPVVPSILFGNGCCLGHVCRLPFQAKPATDLQKVCGIFWVWDPGMFSVSHLKVKMVKIDGGTFQMNFGSEAMLAMPASTCDAIIVYWLKGLKQGWRSAFQRKHVAWSPGVRRGKVSWSCWVRGTFGWARSMGCARAVWCWMEVWYRGKSWWIFVFCCTVQAGVDCLRFWTSNLKIS